MIDPANRRVSPLADGGKDGIRTHGGVATSTVFEFATGTYGEQGIREKMHLYLHFSSP